MDWKKIEEELQEKGLGRLGFADLHAIVPKRYAHLPYGVSLVWKLCDGVVDEIKELARPSFTYFQQYRAINAALDQMSLWLATKIEREGYKALPIGASQSVHDAGEYAGAFQHKTVAVHAGLGWIGKSALFVSKEYGPRVRLATVLTDLALPVPETIDLQSRCGNCDLCVEACPAKAITGKLYQAGATRETIFDPKACSEHMKKAYASIGRGAVCGICMAVCPYGIRKAPEGSSQ